MTSYVPPKIAAASVNETYASPQFGATVKSQFAPSMASDSEDFDDLLVSPTRTSVALKGGVESHAIVSTETLTFDDNYSSERKTNINNNNNRVSFSIHDAKLEMRQKKRSKELHSKINRSQWKFRPTIHNSKNNKRKSKMGRLSIAFSKFRSARNLLIPAIDEEDEEDEDDYDENGVNINSKIGLKKKVYRDMIISFRGTAGAINVKLDMQWKSRSVSQLYWYGTNLPDKIKDSVNWQKCVRPEIAQYYQTRPRSMEHASTSSLSLILQSSSSSRIDEEDTLDLPHVEIHGGFVCAFDALRGELMETVLKFCSECLDNNEIPRFFITGHSLGGAIAQICGLSMEILFGHLSPVFIYSYGSPRVGDHSFAKFLAERVTESYRIVNECDPITTLPQTLRRFFKHGGNEMIVNKEGGVIFAPSAAEKSLLPRRNRATDHMLDNYKESLNAVCKKEGLDHFVL